MELIRFADGIETPISGIAVTAVRDGATLRLQYEVRGDLDRLLLTPSAPVRQDNLWLHTCFEAFIAGPGDAYVEYNLAPSGGWAAYGFDSYREGMRNISAAPVIAWDGATLTAELELAEPGDWHVGLTVVAEASDGSKTFWALAHLGGAPEFHDRNSFVLTLPAA